MRSFCMQISKTGQTEMHDLSVHLGANVGMLSELLLKFVEQVSQ